MQDSGKHRQYTLYLRKQRVDGQVDEGLMELTEKLGGVFLPIEITGNSNPSNHVRKKK
jgi:hypothetical protein